jgi:hypothetical protein
MNNPPLSREKTLKIFKNGIYYSPSSRHYNKPNTNVVCDRCHKTPLDICIGYEDYDMCLSCIQEISKQLKRQKEMEKFPTCVYDKFADRQSPETATYMQQGQFDPRLLTATFMQQSQFRPRPSLRSKTMTNMEQAQFRPTLTKMVQQAFRPGSEMYECGREKGEETKSFMVQSQFRH